VLAETGFFLLVAEAAPVFDGVEDADDLVDAEEFATDDVESSLGEDGTDRLLEGHVGSVEDDGSVKKARRRISELPIRK
jgi:hypothetical protein